jgi:hypothetical protein
MAEESPDVSGDVALEASADLEIGATLGSSSFDVVAGGLVVPRSGKSDDAKGAVELSVTVAVEAVAVLALT